MEDGGVKVLKERLEKFFHRVSPHFSGTYCDSALEIKHKKKKKWQQCDYKTQGVEKM